MSEKTYQKRIYTHVRETDYFSRWGGEEFIILLPETELKEAFVLSEHIRQQVEKQTFSQVNHITVSFGVTQLKVNEQQKTFLKRLDTALYKAKQEGRNISIPL